MNCISTTEDTLQFLTLSSKKYHHRPNRRKGLRHETEILVHNNFSDDPPGYFSSFCKDSNKLVVSKLYQKTEAKVIQQYAVAYENSQELSNIVNVQQHPFVEVTVTPNSGEKQRIQLFTEQKNTIKKNIYRSKSLNREKQTNVYFLYTGKNYTSKRKKKSKFIYSTDDYRLRDEKTQNFDLLLDYLNMEKKINKPKNDLFEDEQLNFPDSQDFDKFKFNPAYCNSHPGECVRNDHSKVKITGRLGLTNDDRYVLQCKATVNNAEVPMVLGSDDVYYSDWNYKSDKSNQTKNQQCIRTNGNRMCDPSQDDFQFSALSNISQDIGLPRNQVKNISVPNSMKVSDNPLVIISVYGVTQANKAESANQTETKFSSLTNEVSCSNDYKIIPSCSLSNKTVPNNYQEFNCCRCCESPTCFEQTTEFITNIPRDQSEFTDKKTVNISIQNIIDDDSIDTVSNNEFSMSLTNVISSSFKLEQETNNKPCCACLMETSPNKASSKKSNKQTSKTKRTTKSANRQTSPIRKNPQKQNSPRSTSPSKNEKNQNKPTVKKTSNQEGSSENPQSVSHSIMKKPRSPSPKRNMSPTVSNTNKVRKPDNTEKKSPSKQTHQLKANDTKTLSTSNKTAKSRSPSPKRNPPKASGKNQNHGKSRNDPNIRVNIEGSKEKYDLSFNQGAEVANVLILKQLKNKLTNIKNKCRNSCYKPCNFQNQYPPMMDQTCVTSDNFRSSVSRGPMYQCPARNTMESSPQTCRRFQRRQDSIDLAHRRSMGNALGVANINGRRSDGKVPCKDYKHYTGDSCDLTDPVERDRQVRNLLGVGTTRPCSSTDYQGSQTVCSMDCLYRQRESPKSSLSFTNTAAIRRDIETVPIHVLVDTGAGSEVIDFNYSTDEESEKSKETKLTLLETDKKSFDIDDISLYKHLTLDHNAATKNNELKPESSSLMIGEVRKSTRYKYYYQNASATKEIQARVSESCPSVSATMPILSSPAGNMANRDELCARSAFSNLETHKPCQCHRSQTTKSSIISQIPEYDSRSVQTIFKAKERSTTPNLGSSDLCVEDNHHPNLEQIKSIRSVSTQIEKQTKTKKLFRRLIPCLVMKNIRSSDVRVGAKANKSSNNSTINSYHISTSPVIDMSSSMFDTSASYYSNHSIHWTRIKSRRGFLSSVKDFLNNRKTCA